MKVKLSLCQIKAHVDKERSVDTMKAFVDKSVAQGADLVCLPEMWNCPYSNEAFPKYAESAQGPTVETMARVAGEKGIYLIGGSIPEKEDDRIYNTCFVFDPKGRIIGKHRKAHLFDIDVKGGITFKESDTLSPGNCATIVDTEYGKIGIGICYDVRFPELFRRMTLEGVWLIFLPAAFNMTTGPAHWELTMRARALDNQVYFAANAPARDPQASYQSYGHSLVVDPWGRVLEQLEAEEGILVREVDRTYVSSIREQLPLLKHRRSELY